jgi:competence protein ComEA
MTSASIAAIAAPVVNPDNVTAPMVQTTPSVESVKVDLSGAGATTLQRELSGVGEAKARAIVAYRESNGPFASVDELLEVKAIGKVILGKNRDKLEVN